VLQVVSRHILRAKKKQKQKKKQELTHFTLSL
jgi:hypothetical protein